MVKLSVEQIKEVIRPCGLSPRKSKAIYDLSHILLDKHNGEVPESFEDLRSFLVYKTASVVTPNFGHPAFLWIRTYIVCPEMEVDQREKC